MSARENIKSHSDSLMELLAAQCADLEQLLALAREENAAARRNDFNEIMRIVTERDNVSGRLETYRQQIGEIRGFLETHSDNVARKRLTDCIIETVNLTLAQDAETKALLAGERDRVALELRKIDNSRKQVAAYQTEPRKGLAYTENL